MGWPSERLGYHKLAAILREQIASGEIRPGERLPSEVTLQQTYGVGRPTVRRAVEQLRKEGLVVTEHGFGSYVRKPEKIEIVRVEDACRVVARMPNPDERAEHLIPDGVPVIVIIRPEQPDQVLPADRHALKFDPR